MTDLPQPWSPLEQAILDRAGRTETPLQSGLDLDGRALNSRWIVGKDDKGLQAQDLQSLIEILSDSYRKGAPGGDNYMTVQAQKLPRGGNVRVTRFESLDPWEVPITAHETGHIVDFRSNLYDALMALEDQERKNKLLSQIGKASGVYARRRGVSAEKDPREALADALALYFVDPVRMKEEFYDTADFIGDIVNTDPLMSKILTFANLEKNLVA